MRILISLLSVILLIACSSKNPEERNFKYVDVPLNGAYVAAESADDEVVKVLQYTGVQSLEDIRIKMRTDHSNYFFFAAVVDYPNRAGSKNYSSTDGRLNFINTFDPCFFYELCAANPHPKEEVLEELSVQLMVDRKMSSILKNDSLYLTLNGFDYNTLSKPMRINGRMLHEFNGFFFDLNGVVPLMSAEVSLNEHQDKDITSKMLVGMISYDGRESYDFDAMFNSPQFVYSVGFPSYIKRQREVGFQHNLFDIDDFIIASDE